MTDVTCTCARIKIGSEITENRNWNPVCPEHGTGTDWFNSPEQVRKRAAASERLRDLQQRAKIARCRDLSLPCAHPTIVEKIFLQEDPYRYQYTCGECGKEVVNIDPDEYTVWQEEGSFLVSETEKEVPFS